MILSFEPRPVSALGVVVTSLVLIAFLVWRFSSSVHFMFLFSFPWNHIVRNLPLTFMRSYSV